MQRLLRAKYRAKLDQYEALKAEDAPEVLIEENRVQVHRRPSKELCLYLMHCRWNLNHRTWNHVTQTLVHVQAPLSPQNLCPPPCNRLLRQYGCSHGAGCVRASLLLTSTAPPELVQHCVHQGFLLVLPTSQLRCRATRARTSPTTLRKNGQKNYFSGEEWE